MKGFYFIWQGFQLLRSDRKLRRLAQIPFLLSILIFSLGVWFFGDIFNWLRDFLPSLDQYQGIGGFFASIADFILNVVVFVVTLTLNILVSFLFLQIVASPFNDALSEAVEKRYEGQEILSYPIPNIPKSIGIAARTESIRLLIFIVVAGPLYLASFIVPGVGQLLVTIALTLYAIFWLSYDALSYSMDRQLWPMKRRIGFLVKHPLNTLGFGGSIYLIAMIPLLNTLVLPLFVTGGTLMLRTLSDPPIQSQLPKSKQKEIKKA